MNGDPTEDGLFIHCKHADQFMAAPMARADQGEILQSNELKIQLNSVLEELSAARAELAQQSEALDATRDELDVQRRHYQELFELAPDGYLVTARDGVICESNLAAASMLGVSNKRLLSEPLSAFIKDDAQQVFTYRLSQMVESKSLESQEWEAEISPRRGRPFPAIIMARCSLDRQGSVCQVRWLIHDISARKSLEQQRQWLLQRVVSVHEEERAAISRDLHDKMAQHLTDLLFGLHSLKTSALDTSVAGGVDKLQGVVENISAEIHQIAKQLRPVGLDDLGLNIAITNLVNEWSAQTGIAASVHTCSFDGVPLSSQMKIQLYRIVQQSLTNVQRHAAAHVVSVVLERRHQELLAIIEDDGVGFNVADALQQVAGRSALGIIGMRERTALLGGTFELDSKPGRGTAVFVRIPLDNKDGRHG